MKYLAVLILCLSGLAEAAVPRAAEKYRLEIIAASHAVFGPKAAVSSIAAQLEVESSWNPKAVSPVGARGLCQFMPYVGVDFAKRYSDLRPYLPFDSGWCIKAIVRYLKERHDRYGEGRSECSTVLAGWVTYVGSMQAFDREVELCRNTVGCNPMRWFDNVELQQSRSDSAFRESRNYPVKILAKSVNYSAAGWGKRWCSAP